MFVHELTKILDAHGINYEIVNGFVMAEDVYTLDGVLHVETLDLTDISKEQLWYWLGY